MSFKAALKTAIIWNSPVYFFLNDTVHADIIYYDFIHTFISKFREDKMIFDDKMKDDLIKIEKDIYLKSDYIKYESSKQPTDTFLIENVFSKISKNFHIIISISNLPFY